MLIDGVRNMVSRVFRLRLWRREIKGEVRDRGGREKKRGRIKEGFR